MTYTATSTYTNTMTEARVRAVMQKVEANLAAFVVAGHVDRARAAKWTGDLIYLQVKQALAFFELQIKSPGIDRFGLRYVVSSDGSIQQDSASGGLDLYGLPKGTTVTLFAHLKDNIPSEIREELKRRGWGFDGSKLDAPESEHRAFSNSGYGITRSKIGTWP